MLEEYIKDSWARLLRNSLDVALDPKVTGGARTYLYIPRDEDPEAINLMIGERRKLTENLGSIEIRVLPEDLIVNDDHGVLYLPHSYIVPGGRFNEMYAWDSYWIILGLLNNGSYEIARGIVENFLYEIRHYGGKTLNANRTYYLTRSQPPMLASMAHAVLPYIDKKERKKFIKDVLDALSTEYEGFWKKCRFNKEQGLFRYGNIEQGPLGLCPEVVYGERDEHGYSHYDKIIAYLSQLAPDDPLRTRFFDEINHVLTPEAIAGDRAMRESGFDASMQMGYFGLETMDFNPICLNSLIYKQCQLMAEMYEELGQPERAHYFTHEAKTLSANIQKYMWDEEAGLFCNYNRYIGKPSAFYYLTAAYPLWAGIATETQAKRFQKNLSLFETPFGVKSTDRQTGCQWDAPFMWAPLVHLTVEGLGRYNFEEEGRRIAQKFIDTVRRVHKQTNANFEKYNAETGDHRTDNVVEVGYSENVVGFGWTNGAVAYLQKWLNDTDVLLQQSVV
jgi:alpha,alpha-trehalase